MVGIDPAGNLVGHRNGDALVRGSSGASLHVIVSASRTLEIVPNRIELPPAGTRTLKVLGDGRELSAEAFRWETSDPNVAAGFGLTVKAGMVPGTSTLTATAAKARATIEVVVRPNFFGSLRLEPSKAMVAVGAVQQLKVDGPITHSLQWTTSNLVVLQPLANGFFYAKAPGTARACALEGGRRACAKIQVMR